MQQHFTHHSVMLVAIADKKPCVLKLSSFAEHKASPLITGTRERLTYSPVCSPEEKKITITNIISLKNHQKFILS